VYTRLLDCLEHDLLVHVHVQAPWNCTADIVAVVVVAALGIVVFVIVVVVATGIGAVVVDTASLRV
jgi:hypothetical protein